MTPELKLPKCMYLKHGRFWYVKKNKWHDLGTKLEAALADYAKRTAPASRMGQLIEAAVRRKTHLTR